MNTMHKCCPITVQEFEREDLRATRLSTSRAVLKTLASSPSKKIRVRVAENSATPISVLKVLCRDQNAEVRSAVAQNLDLPSTALSVLTRDESPDVRFAIAENPHMPLHILNILKLDNNPYVKARAERTVIALHTENLTQLRKLLKNKIGYR